MAVAFLRVTPQLIRARIEELNQRIAQLARRPGFTVVDLFGLSLREIPEHPEYFCDDGFHPSAQGYDRICEFIWPAVEPYARAAASP